MKILHSSGVRASISGKLITIFAREFDTDVDTKSEELYNLKFLKVEKVFRERERKFSKREKFFVSTKKFPICPIFRLVYKILICIHLPPF